MIALILANWFVFAIAGLIGIATGWWVWANRTPVRVDEPVSQGTVPAVESVRPAIAAAVGAPDDLQLLKGVGPKLDALLASLGVTRFDQIAVWGAGEIAEVDQFLGSFKGRIVRDEWVEQARLLAAGDTAAYEARYGALGSEKN